MPAKRTTTAIFASPARRPVLRARKRQKTAHSALSKRLDSDGDDREAAERTDSEYEDCVEHERGQERIASGTKGRWGRRSAPTADSRSTSRAPSTRRSSFATLGGAASVARAGAQTRGAPRPGTEDGLGTVVQQARPRGATRVSQPLSPLPVNHAVERQQRTTRTAIKGKERARDDERADTDMRPLAPAPPRRSSVPPPTGDGAGRVTRRMSSGSVGPEPTRPLGRGRRASWATTEGGSEDELGLDNEFEDRDNHKDSRPNRGMRRKPELEDISDAGEVADEEGGQEESPEASDAGDGNDKQVKLNEWDAHHLEALLKSELVDLYYLAHPASSSNHTVPRTKADLAQAIVEARHRRSALGSDEDDEYDDGADGDDSPHPRTSQEGSPADTAASLSHRARGSSAAAQTPRAYRRKIVLRRSGVRGQEPTPPPSDDSRDGDASSGSSSASGDATEVDEWQPDSQPAASGESTRMTRRASQVEMPPPAFPPAGQRRHMRTRSSISSPKLPSPRLPSARDLALAVDPDEPGGTGATPVAHRTRHHGYVPPVVPLSPHGQRAGLPSVTGSPRPLRAAKRRAVARLVRLEGASNDGEENEDAEMAADDDSASQSGSDDEALHGRSVAAAPRRLAKNVHGTGGRRRSSRTAKQAKTPLSDADEESGGEADRSEANDEAQEAKCRARQVGQSRKSGGRPVRLHQAMAVEEDEAMGDPDNDNDIDNEDEDEDEDEDGDATFRVEAKEDEGMEQNEGAIDLSQATSTTLMRFKKDELMRLCRERDLLEDENRTKPQLVDALLQWRDSKSSWFSSPVSSPLSTSSTISNLSTQTAREETKTQALAGLEHASARTAAGTPLLMRPEHIASPDKPRTPQHSKEHEQQEDVNALDLESLQLRDKEIQPEELTKLELVGSGGFKDVFKGMLDGRTIAICDIRGHLTDMDIKELGLLRDLRHRNIVKFIGVSIPRPPSAVPVMIVTELCANGDLFDYLRKVAAPPFSVMLELMVGIARGIEYLHKRKPTIIHRDIKSSNVLITGEGVPKIADFGLARIKTSTKSMIRSLVGTVNWQAPELWSPHPRYNEKVDVYSVGLVFWEILQWHQPVKRYPFEGQNEHAIYHDVGAKQLRPPAGPLRRQWGSEIIDLMTQMWEQDPALRPSMGHVVTELQRLISAEKAKERAAKRAA